MTAITVGTARRKRNTNALTTAKYTAAEAIVEGALVVVSGANGLAYHGTDRTGCKFVGIACTNAASGSIVSTEYGHEELLACETSFVVSGVGTLATLKDNNTVTSNGSTNDIPVGEVMEAPSATTAWVGIRKFGAAVT